MHFYFTIHQGVFAQNKVCFVGVNSLLRCLNLRIRFDKFCCLFWRFCFYFLSILTVFVILYILLFFSSYAIGYSRSLNFLMRGCPLSGDMNEDVFGDQMRRVVLTASDTSSHTSETSSRTSETSS